MSAGRFTVDGDAALEAHLANVCTAMAAEVEAIFGSEVEGLLLGGGYGRGEGGVLRTPAGDRPYNDLESYIFVRGSTLLADRRHHAALHAAAERLTALAGIEVEFKLVNRRKLRGGTTMFFYDLACGHRRLLGSADLLADCAHQQDASAIPLDEVTRLLLNRCTGLLLAGDRLRAEPVTSAETDFAQRNLAKAELALGDVVLAAHGEYHFSCRTRHERLERFAAQGVPGLAEIVQMHGNGVAFKLHPHAASATEAGAIRERWEKILPTACDLWFWLEERRLGASFGSVRAYALSPLNKCPETHGLRNRLVNAKAFGPRAGFAPSGRGHPRERLLSTLPILLWEPALLNDDEVRAFVASRLLSPGSSLPDAIRAYERLWLRFR